MAQKLVDTENIEFYMLIERMQDINGRLVRDTAKLHDQQVIEDENIEKKHDEDKLQRKRKTEIRQRDKTSKEEWIVKKAEAMTNFDEERTGFSEKLANLKKEFEPKLQAKAEEIAALDMESKDLRQFLDNEQAVKLDLDAIQELVNN